MMEENQATEENKKKSFKIIPVIIGVLLLILIGGGYYWWTGTPEYSINQLKKAIETNNKEAGLKYIDTDSMFENLWDDIKSEATEASLDAEGFEALGMALGLQMLEAMKPAMKNEFEAGIEKWFSAEEVIDEDKIVSPEGGELIKENGSVYVKTEDIKLFFTKKEGKRYWVISRIEGMTEEIFENNSDEVSLTLDFQQDIEGTERQEIYDETDFIEKSMNSEVELATVRFKVTNVEEKNRLSSQYGSPSVAKEGAKFVVITMSITNITKTGFTLFPDDGFRLVDNKEREFTTYTDTIWAVDNHLNVRELAPDITERGVLVYEIPEDARSYSLITGKAGTDEMYRINLK
jgi:hypothetical protein